MRIRTNPLGQINDLAIARFELEQRLIVAIADALLDGATWAVVGDMLGVSKQAAHQRYALPVREYVNRKAVGTHGKAS